MTVLVVLKWVDMARALFNFQFQKKVTMPQFSEICTFSCIITQILIWALGNR